MANLGYNAQNQNNTASVSNFRGYAGLLLPVIFVGGLLVLILSQGKNIK